MSQTSVSQSTLRSSGLVTGFATFLGEGVGCAGGPGPGGVVVLREAPATTWQLAQGDEDMRMTEMPVEEAFADYLRADGWGQHEQQ